MAKFSFLIGEEEPEMIFDWVDMEQKGRLSLEEFSSGLSMSVLGGPLGTYCTASVPSRGDAGLTGRATVTLYQPEDLRNVPERVQGRDENPDYCEMRTPAWVGRQLVADRCDPFFSHQPKQFIGWGLR